MGIKKMSIWYNCRLSVGMKNLKILVNEDNFEDSFYENGSGKI